MREISLIFPASALGLKMHYLSVFLTCLFKNKSQKFLFYFFFFYKFLRLYFLMVDEC